MSEFDRYATSYDEALTRGIAVSGEDKEFFARGRITWLARCLHQLGEQPQRVLDFGCGTGNASPLLRELLRADSVTGVDTSPALLAEAQRQHGSDHIHFLPAADFRPAGQMDLVFCNGVFHHIPLAERAAVAENICRSLRPGGLFALWENNGWHPGARYVMWRIPFDRDAIPLTPPTARRLVADAGLQWLGTTYQFVFPRLLRAFRRWEPSLSRWPLGAQYQVLARRVG